VLDADPDIVVEALLIERKRRDAADSLLGIADASVRILIQLIDQGVKEANAAFTKPAEAEAEGSTETETGATATSETETPDETKTAEKPSDVEAALASIDKFRMVAEQTQFAVLTIGERLADITRERDELQSRLVARDEEFAELQQRLATLNTVTAQRDSFSQENAKLAGENRRLQNIVDALNTVFKKMNGNEAK
jgi:hypothetical protein